MRTRFCLERDFIGKRVKYNLLLICENQSAYSRKYSGESLCSECFCQSILRNSAKMISKYKMIQYGHKSASEFLAEKMFGLLHHIESDVKAASASPRLHSYPSRLHQGLCVSTCRRWHTSLIFCRFLISRHHQV